MQKCGKCKNYFKREATNKIQRLLLKGRQLEKNQRLLFKKEATQNKSKTTFKREATRRRAAAGGNIRKSCQGCFLTPREVRTPQCKHCLGKKTKIIMRKSYANHAEHAEIIPKT